MAAQGETYPTHYLIFPVTTLTWGSVSTCSAVDLCWVPGCLLSKLDSFADMLLANGIGGAERLSICTTSPSFSSSTTMLLEARVGLLLAGVGLCFPDLLSLGMTITSTAVTGVMKELAGCCCIHAQRSSTELSLGWAAPWVLHISSQCSYRSPLATS